MSARRRAYRQASSSVEPTAPGPTPWPHDAAALVSLLAGLLIASQYVTMPKLAVLCPAVSRLSVAGFAAALRAHVTFSSLDAALFGGMAAAVAGLVAVQVRRRHLTQLVAAVLSSESRTLWAVVAAGAVLARFFLGRGPINWAADTPQHMCYSLLAAQAISHGDLPTWTNSLGAGIPYLQYYGFLFPYLVGLVNVVVRDVYLATKLSLWGGHVASGVTMYLLVRTLTGSRQAGLVAGLGYVASFWHTQHVVTMGRLPLSLFYALLPLPFYFAERLRSASRRLTCSLGGAVCLGCLGFVHPGYAFFATALLGLYLAVRLVPFAQERVSRAAAAWTAFLYGVGILFGGYLTLAMWLEAGGTGLTRRLYMGDLPVPTLHLLLGWSNFMFWIPAMEESGFRWYGGYLGLSVVALAGLGLLAGTSRRWRWQGSATLAVAGALGASLLLTFGGQQPPLCYLGVVQAFPPYRFLLFVLFFLCVAAGIGVRTLVGDREGAVADRVAAAALLAVLVDLGPTTLQQPYASFDPTGDIPRLVPHASAPAIAGELPPYRALWAFGDRNPYYAKGILLYGGKTPSVHSFHPGDPLSGADFVDPLQRVISYLTRGVHMNSSLDDVPQWRTVLGAAIMLNARVLIANLAGSQSVTGFDLGDYASPVLVSARAVSVPDAALRGPAVDPAIEAAFQATFAGLPPVVADSLRAAFPAFWIVQQTAPSLTDLTCARLLLRDAVGERDLGTRPQATVLEHRVWEDHALLRLRVTEACFARLAYSFHRSLEVRVDGQRVPALETTDHFVAMTLPAGEHTVELRPRLSLLRRAFLGIDVLVLVALAGAWAHQRGLRLPGWMPWPGRLRQTSDAAR